MYIYMYVCAFVYVCIYVCMETLLPYLQYVDCVIEASLLHVHHGQLDFEFAADAFVVCPQLLDDPLVARLPVVLLVDDRCDQAGGREKLLIGQAQLLRQLFLERVVSACEVKSVRSCRKVAVPGRRVYCSPIGRDVSDIILGLLVFLGHARDGDAQHFDEVLLHLVLVSTRIQTQHQVEGGLDIWRPVHDGLVAFDGILKLTELYEGVADITEYAKPTEKRKKRESRNE